MAEKKKQSLVKWQLPMKRVLYALAPIIVCSIYFFGWRVLVMLAIANAAGFLTEYLCLRSRKEPVSSAVFVTGTLFTLSVSPMLPYWMLVVGVVFGVLFGKMVFGGFGMNPFNPALTGRAFIYVSFGAQMTGEWYRPFGGFPGGFGVYGFTRATVPADAFTTATPGAFMKFGAERLEEIGLNIESLPDIWDLFLGHRISGVIGGTSALLTILCGIWLVRTKTANYRIVVPAFLGYAAIQLLFWLTGVANALDPLTAAFSGSLVIGVFFYATDPVSASQTNTGRWIYGGFIGIMSSVIANLSEWPAGTMFAILLANMFAPLMDYIIRERQKARKLQGAKS